MSSHPVMTDLTPEQIEGLRALGRRLFNGDTTPFNINALDPECPYSVENHDETEEGL